MKVFKIAVILQRELTPDEETMMMNKIWECINKPILTRLACEVFFSVGKETCRAYVTQLYNEWQSGGEAKAYGHWYRVQGIDGSLSWATLKIILQNPTASLYNYTPGSENAVPLAEQTLHLPDADGTYRA
jgi:hypothetical protein